MPTANGAELYYTALVRMADTNARLADDLRQPIDFMPVGRRKKPVEPPK